MIPFRCPAFCDFLCGVFCSGPFLFFFFIFKNFIVSFLIKEGLLRTLFFSECFFRYIFIFRTKMPVMTLLITMITLNQKIQWIVST